MLAVVLALQEWRHWLEGSIHPFIVWSDHKNLSYLQSARRLNSRQARWALFLGRFNFTLTFRPGTRNIKPDALSRQFSSPVEDAVGNTILPSSCVVGAAGWEIEGVVQGAQKDQPVPHGCPPKRLFVPPSARSPVLQWGHSSRISCHPGFHRTLTLIQQRFWWPQGAWLASSLQQTRHTGYHSHNHPLHISLVLTPLLCQLIPSCSVALFYVGS